MKNINKKIFEKLRGKAELSTNKGKVDKTKNRKANSKIRRHSGRREVFCDDEDYPIHFTYYDDWFNYRDGMRAGWDEEYLEEEKKKKKRTKLKKFLRKIKELTHKTK